MLVQQEALLEPAPMPRRHRPSVRGPAAVRASLIAAASELFAARGTASVSVREIADRAGVNHGLIHHYFHSKQGLIDATLEDLGTQAAKALEDAPDLSPDGPLARYVLVASRALLDADQAFAAAPVPAAGLPDGAGPEERPGLPGGPHPESLALAGVDGAKGMVALLRRLAELSSSVGTSDVEARMRGAHLAAMLIGWLLFEPVLVGAAGLSSEDPGWVRRQLLRSALG
jgi:AcrR family transcriptional regulator